MPREFTAADVVQRNSGFSVATVDPGVSLPAPSSDGHAGVIMIFGATVLTPPEQWDMAAWSAPTAAQTCIMCRADLPAGEQSWPFDAISHSGTSWAWIAEEWSNLSYAPVLATSRAAGTADPTSESTGTTGTWDSPYAVGIAVISMLTSVNGSVWPTWSAWSGGFTETDVITNGTGATAGNCQLRVARRYGTLGETGGWGTSASFTGSTTGKSTLACLVVFRAEAYPGEA